MIKKIAALVLLLCTGISVKAQLANDIGQIAQQHDLMGGVVTLYCADQLIEHLPFGWADYGRQIPVTDSTLFRIASISKTVTAMAFMKLVDDGLVALDDDISGILGYAVVNPNFPSVPITPRMLLSHRSSIVDGNTYSGFLSATNSQNPIPNLSGLLLSGGAYYSSSQFNNTQPGTYFNYSNTNYVIVGTLIEKLSGQRFDEYVRGAILLPLQLSGSFNVNHIANLDNLAVLYRKVSGNWVAQVDNYGGVQPVFTNLGGYIPGTNGARFSPQGGLRCSGADLSKIMRVLLNKGTYNGQSLLSAGIVAQMMADEWTFTGSNGNNYDDLFNSWGLGLHRIKNIPNADVVLTGSQAMFGHPGEAYGLVSDAYIDTTRLLGLVFMTNGCGAGYQLGGQSAFYTVEKQVFEAIDPYANLLSCNPLSVIKPVPGYPSCTLYPNPTNNHIIIQTGTANTGSIITLHDYTAREIYRGTLQSETTVLPMGPYPPGIYFVSIHGKHPRTFKVCRY